MENEELEFTGKWERGYYYLFAAQVVIGTVLLILWRASPFNEYTWATRGNIGLSILTIIEGLAVFIIASLFTTTLIREFQLIIAEQFLKKRFMSGKEEGLAQGRDEGYKEGYEAGLKAAQESTDTTDSSSEDKVLAE